MKNRKIMLGIDETTHRAITDDSGNIVLIIGPPRSGK